jgi:hypothetical protein
MISLLILKLNNNASLVPCPGLLQVGTEYTYYLDCCTPDSRRMRVTSTNPTQLLRAPAARGTRNKGCYFWTPQYVVLPTTNGGRFLCNFPQKGCW